MAGEPTVGTPMQWLLGTLLGPAWTAGQDRSKGLRCWFPKFG